MSGNQKHLNHRPAAATGDDDHGKGTVLIVDDFDDGREMYSDYLEFLGYHVETAKNGAEALEKAHQTRPDVILMDLSMPVLSGWDATRLLKGDQETCDIPVVALTAHGMAKHSAAAKEAGCDDFVAKPCMPDELEKKIRSLMSPNDKPKP